MMQSFKQTIQKMMSGGLSDSAIISVLQQLKQHGETAEQLYTAAIVMRQLSNKITVNDPQAIDIVGTGGDKAGIANISTATAIVVAASGVTVAKHGNRSFSSKSGSADLLQLAGVDLDLSAKQVEQLIANIGLGFLFAPLYHPAMRHVMAARKQFGQRSIFNLLGPLTNPANLQHYLLGVYHKKWLQPFAQVLQKLGCRHAMIVCSQDGLDEISIAATTDYIEIKQGQLQQGQIEPRSLGFKRQSLESAKVDNAKQSLQYIQQALAGKAGAVRDMIILNSGVALYIADKVSSISDGVQLATHSIHIGEAQDKFQQLITVSQQLGKVA